MKGETSSSPVSAFILFEVFLVVPLLFNPVRFRGFVSFSILLALFYQIIMSTTGSHITDWSIGLTITPHLLKALDVLLMTDAERSLRRNEALEDDPAAFGLFTKTCWAFELIHNSRGVGWNWEVPYVCYTGTESRGKYIRSRLPRAILYYVLLDLLQHKIPRLSGDPALAEQPFSVATLVATWSCAVSVYLHLWLVHTVPALIIVWTKLGVPSSYPYVMGPIGLMSSLRCFWGRTWHQTSRRPISSLGLWLRERVSWAPRGSCCSAYIQLCVGFAVGGATHAIAGFMAGDRKEWHDLSGAGTFFFMQLLGVMLEDAVFAVLRRTGVLESDWRMGHMDGGKKNYGATNSYWKFESWSKAVGYLIVFGWLSWTIAPYLEGLRRVGALETKPLPFSIVDWALS